MEGLKNWGIGIEKKEENEEEEEEKEEEEEEGRSEGLSAPCTQGHEKGKDTLWRVADKTKDAQKHFMLCF